MSSTETQDRTPGSLAAAVSNLIVRLFSEYTGRGPHKARITIRENVVLCVTQNAMTKGERGLVEEGEGDTVVSIRRKFQTTMCASVIQAVAVRAEVARTPAGVLLAAQLRRPGAGAARAPRGGREGVRASRA